MTSVAIESANFERSDAAKHGASTSGTRLLAIDALRGLVMLAMLVDHVRETWYLHMQVSDPVNAFTVAPALFFTRFTSHICAPVFIVLTGLSAWLYGQSHSLRETSIFLLKRGAFLMVLDITLITLAWSTTFPPRVFWLQVIWTIGFCMIALAALIHLPRVLQAIFGAVIVLGHNLLDTVVLHSGDAFFVPWAMLHQRDVIEIGAGFVAKTTYPVLPWVGVILIGYAIGPWFVRGSDSVIRQRRLCMLGVAFIVGFIGLRALNVYGDKPWVDTGDALRTIMSFLALTKYPPSLLFLLPTLGLGALLLALLERFETSRCTSWLALLGGAAMFFYILHIYVLRTFYQTAMLIWGPDHGAYFGFDWIGWVWIWALALVLPLYYPTRWFASLKRRRRDIWWLKYF